MDNIIIKGTNLCRYYKSGEQTINALKNVDIEIKEGTLTILRGRSGAGKTTLINILGAIDRPDAGEVYFNNAELSSLTDKERDEVRRINYGFVFQSIALIPNMTAYENIEFELLLSNYPASERDSRIKDCLKLVGLSNRAVHFPSQLSGGEAQRIAIARSIAHKPKVIFADEPTGALDTKMGLQVVNVFKSLVQNEKLTVVMTTHDPNMMEIADYVYTLQDGEIVNE
ncbi:MAG TPA: macrolide ABC transporter ATP-binding protein [Clostridiaceae bacterium]|jgi:putative ABC transport system ATP-binding protein|nr:macrolide ABC transporter ATP-binding protein [Clostridiaceae bacterium]HBF76774.1 macrolide ABC transporter ATP-binding protein [Clostridiaceae bacterium]HBG37634.1 macrolide ABC transporter ATP-binding protein [Clostridiaceae bacterium]HBN28210.1 macrolide ABC transporter ATP-binding protein [Clostridiaceae bacterium]HBX48453.1 macrolide ABC transporter ATP-binding protein [Clostridiaceae bacterium]